MTRASRTRRPKTCLLAAAALPLAGCANLPSLGPTAHDIVRAEQRLQNFELKAVDEAVIAGLHNAPSSGRGRLAVLTAAGEVDGIGPGDILQITIYEVGAALFSGRSMMMQPGSPQSSGEGMPPITVGRDGTILLPWVGRVMAAGKTPDQLAAELSQAYRRNSESPQVLVTLRENLNNSVVIQGDVKKPGRLSLSLARERLLDAIAIAGGSASPMADSMVRVSRGAQSAEQPLSLIDSGTEDDLLLLPQDRVTISYRARSFTVLGATGKAAEVPFQTLQVSLAEAIGRAGGLNDNLADPGAVFVFRYEPANLDGTPVEGARPVAYRVNMREPNGFFLSQRFEMRPRDVVYVAAAGANIPTKAIQILNLFFSPFYTARVLTR